MARLATRGWGAPTHPETIHTFGLLEPFTYTEQVKPIENISWQLRQQKTKEVETNWFIRRMRQVVPEFVWSRLRKNTRDFEAHPTWFLRQRTGKQYRISWGLVERVTWEFVWNTLRSKEKGTESNWQLRQQRSPELSMFSWFLRRGMSKRYMINWSKAFFNFYRFSWNVLQKKRETKEISWYLRLRKRLVMAVEIDWRLHQQRTKQYMIDWLLSFNTVFRMNWYIRLAKTKTSSPKWGINFLHRVPTAMFAWRLYQKRSEIPKIVWYIRRIRIKRPRILWYRLEESEILPQVKIKYELRRRDSQYMKPHWYVRLRHSQYLKSKWYIRLRNIIPGEIKWYLRQQEVKQYMMKWLLSFNSVFRMNWYIRLAKEQSLNTKWTVRTSKEKISKIIWYRRENIKQIFRTEWNIHLSKIKDNISFDYIVNRQHKFTKTISWTLRTFRGHYLLIRSTNKGRTRGARRFVSRLNVRTGMSSKFKIKK